MHFGARTNEGLLLVMVLKKYIATFIARFIRGLRNSAEVSLYFALMSEGKFYE